MPLLIIVITITITIETMAKRRCGYGQVNIIAIIAEKPVDAEN